MPFLQSPYNPTQSSHTTIKYSTFPRLTHYAIISLYYKASKQSHHTIAIVVSMPYHTIQSPSESPSTPCKYKLYTALQGLATHYIFTVYLPFIAINNNTIV